MVVGEMAEPVDLLVVGAGPGGYVAALRAAELGRQVTLVDRAGPEGGTGGACLHVGCIPSKALIVLADTYHRAAHGAVGGLLVEKATVDLAEFQTWKSSIIDALAAGVDGLLKRHGVQRITGHLRFTRPHQAAVSAAEGTGKFLEFGQAIVATGSRPATLPGLPVDGDFVIDSTGALALDHIPPTIAIVGAGYIGLEIGTALAKLGSKVTVVEARERILPDFDESLASPVSRTLTRLGVTVLTGRMAVKADAGQLLVKGPDGEQRIPAAKVIVAVGRQPNTDQLGLGSLGVAVGSDGLIPVDERRLAASYVAAIGDITAGPALAHKASGEARVAAEALCGQASGFDPMSIPVAVFTDPEIATTGLAEVQARNAGADVAVRSVPTGANGRAATLGGGEGFTRLIVDRATERVLGVQIVGHHASELIAEATLAIEMTATATDLLATIHPHPTLSEGLASAAEALIRAGRSGGSVQT
jgi:dihydrolipoamide dehydrogenase